MSERRLAVALSLAGAVLAALIALVTTPLIVTELGVAGFGAYAMALSALAVLMLCDGGLTDAVVRHLVVSRQAGAAPFAATFGRVVPLYLLAAGAVLLAGTLCIAGAALAGASGRTAAFGALAAFGAAAALSGNPFRAAMLASERFVAARLVDIAGALATAMLTVTAALAGGGPVGVFAAMVAGLVLVALSRVLYVRRRLALAPPLAAMPRDERRELRAYATPILLGHIVEALYFRIDALIVGLLLGPQSVAVYAVALLFQKHAMRLSIAITRVKVPETIALVEAGASPQRLAVHLARVARVQAMFLGAAVIALAAFGDTFLALWLGPAFVAAHPLMLIVLAPYALEQVGSLRNVVLQVRRLYGVRTRQALAIALANAAATAALLPVAGLWGAALTTAAGLLAGLVLANRLLARRGGVDVAALYRDVARRTLLPLGLLAVAAGVLDAAGGSGWGAFVVVLAAYGASFCVVAFGLVANAAERAAVRAFAWRVIQWSAYGAGRMARRARGRVAGRAALLRARRG